jgi:hypothetical protein
MLTLGDKLVAEMELSAEVDTLARWMAHYLAELLVNARMNKHELKDERNAEIFKLILELWKHRQYLPEKSRPFREFQPVCRVLDSLDLDTSRPRYFNYIGDLLTEEKINTSTNTHLTAIRAIDRSARLLIQFVIQLATEQKAEAGIEWLNTAKLAGIPDDDEMVAVRFVVAGGDIHQAPNVNAERLQKINRALAALDIFTKTAPLLRNSLKITRETIPRTAVPEKNTNSVPQKQAGKAAPKKRNR